MATKRSKITEANAAALTKGELFDTQVDGFYVRAGKRANAFVFVVQVDGKNIRRTIGKVGIDKVADMRTFAAEEIAKLRRGTSELLEVNKPRTLRDCFAEYEKQALDERGTTTTWMREQKSLFNRCVDGIADVPLKQVTKGMVKDVRKTATDLTTPRQAEKVIDLIATLFVIAREEGWSQHNPASRKAIKRSKRKRSKAYFNKAEMERIVAACMEIASESTKQHPCFASAHLVAFLALTGARYSEAAEACWDEFDLETNIWTRGLLKSHQDERPEHPIRMSAGAVAIIRRMRAYNPDSEFVFAYERSGRPMHDIRTVWGNVLKRAKIDWLDAEPYNGWIKAHTLRHSFITNMIIANHGNVEQVMKYVGHSSLAMTMWYRQYTTEELGVAGEVATQMFDVAIPGLEIAA